ncbi:MAG: hypothetical protein K2G67_07485 [Muribaculaceae bacterium]|nr:hypothetical protein [Muribaculaceae bacterium]
MKKILTLFAILSCFILPSCGGDDDEPDYKYQDVVLNCNATYEIPNAGDVEWSSSNEFIASVTGNIVTAERVGEVIISSSRGSFKLTVNATSHVFNEPCIQWGASKSTVKSFMKNATPYEETSTSLNYKGTGAQLLTSYSFESDKLKSSGVGLDGDYVNSDAIVTFMLERYIPLKVDQTNYSFYFCTPDEKTGILMSLRTSGRTIIYLIVYVPLTDSKSRSSGLFPEVDIEKYGFITSPDVADEFEAIKSMI